MRILNSLVVSNDHTVCNCYSNEFLIRTTKRMCESFYGFNLALLQGFHTSEGDCRTQSFFKLNKLFKIPFNFSV